MVCNCPRYKKIIDTIKPERFILANDNDFSGIRFNIQYMGSLKVSGQPDQAWQAYMTEGNQKIGNPNQLRLTLPKGVESPPGKSPEELAQRIISVMNQGHLVEETKAKVKVGKTYLGDTEITVDIPNNRPMLIRAENLTKEIRLTDNHFYVNRSVEKDFNDDLKVKADKNQQEIDKIRANRPENRQNDPITLQPEWLQKLQSQFKNDPAAIANQKSTVKVGPTGLPMHQYEKGAVNNELPKDGAKRIRKETPAPVSQTAKTPDQSNKPVISREQSKSVINTDKPAQTNRVRRS